jgi:hypothetical protein
MNKITRNEIEKEIFNKKIFKIKQIAIRKK